MRRGFTLIELIVSIGIISVLIAITLPALSSSMMTAKRVRCQVNLRSLGQSMSMYLDSGDGMLPEASRFADARIDRMEPFRSLSAHMSSPLPVFDEASGLVSVEDPWACPSDPVFAESTGFSYGYSPLTFFDLLYGRRAVTRMHTSSSKAVMFLDLQRFHAGRGNARKNCVRLDGSASIWDGDLGIVF